MLFPGTEMHVVTFGFIFVELVLLLHLCIFKTARPDHSTTSLDITLLSLLVIYNIAGGLLPDRRLPGSYIFQESLAYATGFLTPCYFPHYVYKAFNLKGMIFHVKKGVALFLVLPLAIFISVLYITKNISTAKEILIIPVGYAAWVILSAAKSVKLKYGSLISINAKEELIVLCLCLTPWLCLPLIAYFDVSQWAEVTSTNLGFLLLFGLHLNNNVKLMKADYQQLQISKAKLETWNQALLSEVEKRTSELERLSREERFMQRCKQFRLTQREREVALMVVMGNTYKQVAQQLYIAERTVAKHIQNIFIKLNVSNKTELCVKLGV
ncbi:response regulator transcription factor [Niabella sp. 22666]|uniref:response regulator transcription factor n=1 Tax=Niabella sp. 22666 TaxID=3453954 RepID=UPI003F8732CB